MTSAKMAQRFAAVAWLALWAGAAAAREGWDCNYEGADASHYVVRFERHGAALVERHWPEPLAYRILLDSRAVVIAAHAYVTRAGFRTDSHAGATVLIIDKRSGRMRRSSAETGEDADEIAYGSCARLF